MPKICRFVHRSTAQTGPEGVVAMSTQQLYRVRLGWGLEGVRRLAPVSDVVVIVDVLSFSTTVDVAVGRGAAVIPWRWRDESAPARAAELSAVLAVSRRDVDPRSRYSLSPASCTAIPSGTRLVLPSPNGATLAAIAAESGATVLAGCLRNATAVGLAAHQLGRRVTVVAAGEHWPDGASWRPALEDELGAGAILDAIGFDPSPEAWLASAAFRAAGAQAATLIADGESGRELRDRGFSQDVEIATQHDVSRVVPRLVDGEFVDGR